MSISFDGIPASIRVPLAYVEFDSTRAQSLADESYRILVLGQRTAAGSVAAGEPTLVESAAQAERYFGRGSMLAAEFAALKAANRTLATWAIASDDDAAAAAATGTVALAGTAAENGTLAVYVAGVAVRVAVALDDTAATVATALADKVNAMSALPVTATASSATVTLTARNKGEAGNDLDIRLNYRGEQTPIGLTATITPMSGGSANPDISQAIAAMGDEWYQAIVMPYTDEANLAALETELASRFGPIRQIDGIAYAAFRGTMSETDTFGGTQNSPHLTVMGTGEAPQPPYLWAATIAGVAAGSLEADPARPLQTLALPGILAPAADKRFTWTERNLLLHNGIATFSTAPDGSVAIERLITTYQKTDAGLADSSYLDVNTLATLSYIRYQTRARITTTFPRTKLAADGTRIAPGQAIVTPRIIRAELVSLAQEFVAQGIVEDLDQFKADLVVEIDASDPNRVNVLSSPDLVNQLRIFADQIQFLL